MKLTPSLLEAFLKCPTKCFLLAHEQVPTGNAWADWIRDQREAYCATAVHRLKSRLDQRECVTGSLEPPALKSPTWRLASDLRVEVENMRSCLQALESIPTHPGHPPVLLPIRFVCGNRPTLTDKLVLAFDALVLSSMSGQVITSGRIICGDEHARWRIRLPGLMDKLRKETEKVSKLISGDSP